MAELEEDGDDVVEAVDGGWQSLRRQIAERFGRLETGRRFSSRAHRGDEVRSNRRPGTFDGAIAFDPRSSGAPLAISGPGCPTNLAGLRASHQSVLMARKLMIDCAGNARRWPNNRRYSAAAFGMDDEGRAVLVHVRTPYRMGRLSQMLAAPELGLRGLVYMEGGPEASLVVRDGSTRVGETGSWEDGFNPNDTNHEYWDLPNVIAFERR